MGDTCICSHQGSLRGGGPPKLRPRPRRHKGPPGADCPLPLRASHSSRRDLQLQNKPLSLSAPSDQWSQHWRPSSSRLPSPGAKLPLLLALPLAAGARGHPQSGGEGSSLP